MKIYLVSVFDIHHETYDPAFVTINEKFAMDLEKTLGGEKGVFQIVEIPFAELPMDAVED